jgi:hypothetical protein
VGAGESARQPAASSSHLAITRYVRPSTAREPSRSRPSTPRRYDAGLLARPSEEHHVLTGVVAEAAAVPRADPAVRAQRTAEVVGRLRPQGGPDSAGCAPRAAWSGRAPGPTARRARWPAQRRRPAREQGGDLRRAAQGRGPRGTSARGAAGTSGPRPNMPAHASTPQGARSRPSASQARPRLTAASKAAYARAPPSSHHAPTRA